LVNNFKKLKNDRKNSTLHKKSVNKGKKFYSMTSSFQKFSVCYEDSDRGYYAQANQFLKKDTTILLEEPLIWAIEEEFSNKICHNCLKLLDSYVNRSLYCYGCNYCVYCSEKCKNNHWYFHRHYLECNIIKNLIESSITPNRTYLMVIRSQLYLKWWKTQNQYDTTSMVSSREHGKRNHPSIEKLQYLNDVLIEQKHFHTPSDLMFLIEHQLGEQFELNNSAIGKEICELMMVEYNSQAEYYINCTYSEEVTAILHKIAFNAFSLKTSIQPDYVVVGAIYPRASVINHSCNPNCYCCIIDGNKLEIKTSEPVYIGSELTISYINQQLPLKKRQKELIDCYNFCCSCLKCINEMGTS
jgi:hypothetical protein